MGASDAQKRASLKWERENNEKITIKLRVDKDPSRAEIRRAAEVAGMSMNAFIIEAIQEKMKTVDTAQTNPKQSASDTCETESPMNPQMARYPYPERFAQEMTLEQFKRAVEENLTSVVGQEKAVQLMAEYADDFPQFYEENWSVAGITPALIMRGI